ncbi:MAG: hypothetical protein KY445_00945 [Armatimonadetes bacterium]|nr:hypothetical protein [Armatimonadota bacterium]
MKHSDWTAPYRRAPRIDFRADTRQGRRERAVRGWAIRIICFAVILTASVYALGWALSVAPTLQ